MTALTIVTHEGFVADDWTDRPRIGFADALAGNLPGNAHLCLENTAEVEDLIPVLSRLEAVSILFPSVHDGRGFSLARKLRNLGYKGELRAEGHLHLAQYRHALECGFTSVALLPASVERMPERYWLNVVGNQYFSYQAKFFNR